MWIRIDPQSAEPIFEQVVFQVKGAVARGQLSEGDRLPSVRELAKDLAVNPNTVIRAGGRATTFSTTSLNGPAANSSPYVVAVIRPESR